MGLGGPPMVTVLLCPGQGAQKVGMGKDLADRYPAARECFDRIDEALGVALTRIMWEGPEGDLTQTHNTQPAILAHTAAVWAVVRDRLGGSAAVALGHSLGEYSAYVTAGALTPEQAAQLVRRRGELMHEAGTRRPGSMAAVLGLATEQVLEACREASSATEVVVGANLNAPDQTVISGDPPAVERAGQGCKAAGAKRVVPLKVSGAFHSPLMAPAVPGLEEAITAAPFEEPRVPVVANATAEVVRTAARARRLLVEQLTAPVRWVEGMRRAAELAPEATYVELGPGGVLSGLAKRVVPRAATLPLGTADELERFLCA
ncbi:MAG TPA: ACP S-malonyltransferase [Gemmatimonadales bacterium]|nr:ACP S-malonyltransferase [Gemmatimonadales bacterium]